MFFCDGDDGDDGDDDGYGDGDGDGDDVDGDDGDDGDGDGGDGDGDGGNQVDGRPPALGHCLRIAITIHSHLTPRVKEIAVKGA